MAFTRISVPSEPTFASFSTHPLSLSFSTMRNWSSKVSESVSSFSLFSASSFTSDCNKLTACRFCSTSSSWPNRLNMPRAPGWFRSQNSLMVTKCCMIRLPLGTICKAMLLMTPAKLRSTKSLLMSLIVLRINPSFESISAVSFPIRWIKSVYASFERRSKSMILSLSMNSLRSAAKVINSSRFVRRVRKLNVFCSEKLPVKRPTASRKSFSCSICR